MAAVILWNAVYLGQIIKLFRKIGKAVKAGATSLGGTPFLRHTVGRQFLYTLSALYFSFSGIIFSGIIPNFVNVSLHINW